MSSDLYRSILTEYNQTRFAEDFGEQEKRIMSIRKLGSIAMLLSISALAQPPAPKPDSPEVKALIEKTKKTAGAMWADEEHFFCEAPRPNSPNDPVIAPTKIFDNVYAIGNSGTTVYVSFRASIRNWSRKPGSRSRFSPSPTCRASDSSSSAITNSNCRKASAWPGRPAPNAHLSHRP